MSEPQYRCAWCGRIVMVDRYARGFPPDSAKRKLVKLCASADRAITDRQSIRHKAEPVYTAGIA